MKLPYLLITALFLSSTLFAQSNLKSPNEFMRHEYGVTFTPHHQLVDYFKYVADNTNHINYFEYGETNENRPLIFTVISSQKNLKNIEQIRNDNLVRALEKDGTTKTNIPIVWLSYGVHGNEAGASESSIATIYELALMRQPGIKEWLEKVVVILDPCINPDGYSRYTSWNNGVSNKQLNIDPASREHNEPWPGGRVNHYLFDLNRDWAWLSQVESQQRIKEYQKWIPQVHVDFHEMGHNEPYYFAPAAKPYHQYITDWQGDFQHAVGKNHSKYFDVNGWHYFSKEVFDLLYPSYGDTYPIFNGGVGMTYEQGGHSRAGKGISMENGDTLMLADRIEHHLTTGLSTIETSAKNADLLIKNFATYYSRNSENPPGKYKSFIISSDNTTGKLHQLCTLLDQHKIRYSRFGKDGEKISGWDYHAHKNGEYYSKADDILISARQPKSILTQVLFEPEPFLEDSLTYDITAWALPYAHGLKAIAATKVYSGKGEKISHKKAKGSALTEKSYAAIIPWESMESSKFVAALNQAGVKLRMATSSFVIGGKSYPIGTLVANRIDNKFHPKGWAKVVNDLSSSFFVNITETNTGLSEKGPDLGSSKFQLLATPKILVLGGEKVGANDFGQVWHFLEQTIDYPHTIISPAEFGGVELDDFNTLILPSGWYSFSESERSTLKDWVSEGGRVVALSGALRNFADKDGFALKKRTNPKEEEKTIEQKTFEQSERDFLKNFIPGAIFKVNMDDTNPIAAGFNSTYYSLKTGSTSYDLLDKGWNVGVINDNADHLGFAGSATLPQLKNSLVLGVEEKGSGDLIYFADNPLFRSFWAEGARLMTNAIFLHAK